MRLSFSLSLSVRVCVCVHFSTERQHFISVLLISLNQRCRHIYIYKLVYPSSSRSSFSFLSFFTPTLCFSVRTCPHKLINPKTRISCPPLLPRLPQPFLLCEVTVVEDTTAETHTPLYTEIYISLSFFCGGVQIGQQSSDGKQTNKRKLCLERLTGATLSLSLSSSLIGWVVLVCVCVCDFINFFSPPICFFVLFGAFFLRKERKHCARHCDTSFSPPPSSLSFFV